MIYKAEGINILKNIKSSYSKDKFTFLLFFLLISLFILLTSLDYTRAAGEENAEQLLQGQKGHIIEFTAFDKTYFSNKNYILILYNNNKYYVSEISANPEKRARIHIIKEDQIKSANITLIDWTPELYARFPMLERFRYEVTSNPIDYPYL